MNANNLLSNNSSYNDNAIDASAINSLVGGVSLAAKLCNISSLIVDFDNHQVLYMTPNLIYLDKATPKDKLRDCPNPYWSYIPEEILEFLLQLKQSSLHLIHNMLPEDYKMHVCITDFPIVIRGKEFYVSQKFTPLVVDEKGIIRIGLFTITPSIRKHIDSTIITESGQYFSYNSGMKKYEQADYSTILTETEKSILKSSEMGMTNEEIADYHNVSLSAVKANITRILKKLAVKKIHDAVTIARNYRII